MDVQTMVTVTLSSPERKELARILGCAEKDLPKKIEPFLRAAAKEYITMFLGQKVYSRGSDMLEYRLFLLVQEAFGNTIPDEQGVSRLFQTTANESRSLIRSVMSKYQYQLKTAIESSLQKLLEAAQHTDGDPSYTVTINSVNLVDELNRVLAGIDGNLPSVQKKRGSVATYEIEPSSYTRLCERLGVTPAGVQ